MGLGDWPRCPCGKPSHRLVARTVHRPCLRVGRSSRTPVARLARVQVTLIAGSPKTAPRHPAGAEHGQDAGQHQAPAGRQEAQHHIHLLGGAQRAAPIARRRRRPPRAALRLRNTRLAGPVLRPARRPHSRDRPTAGLLRGRAPLPSWPPGETSCWSNGLDGNIDVAMRTEADGRVDRARIADGVLESTRSSNSASPIPSTPRSGGRARLRAGADDLPGPASRD